MTAPAATPAPALLAARAAPRRPVGFVLLEVLVSLVILGVSLTIALRQMTLCLRAIGHCERMTVATLLARGLVEKWELTPPARGEATGDFGEEYPGFTYKIDYEFETIEYENISRSEEVGRLVPLRRVQVEIYWQSPRRERRDDPKRLLHFVSGLSSSERFTAMARLANEIRFDQ